MAKPKPERRQQRAERDQRAAAALEAQRQRERRRARLNYAAVGVAVLLVIVIGFVLTRGGDTEVDAPAAGTGDLGVAIGSADAPHQVIVYEDFACPACGAFEEASGEDLAERAEAGDVYVEYRPFNLLDTEHSIAAASAFKVVLDASGPEVAKTFHDLLFADQPDESGPYPDADALVATALEAGAVEADVRPGIEDQAQAGWVEEVTESARDAGVGGTPTVILDGEVFEDGNTIEDRVANLLEAIG